MDLSMNTGTGAASAEHDGASMKPVIFLDFDDALAVHKLHESYRVLDAAALGIIDSFPELLLNIFDATARRNVQALHDEFGPRYVISSLWASHLNLEQMRKMLKRCGLKFVALNLCEHWCTPRSDTSGRLSEIEAWLELHTSENGPPYVIIDDHISGSALSGSWLEERTVLCDASVGFTAAKLMTAREILHA
jgi:hypothetical protein